MVIKYSEKADKLLEFVKPYLDCTQIPVVLKYGTPESVKEAYEEWQRITDEEEQAVLEEMGLI